MKPLSVLILALISSLTLRAADREIVINEIMFHPPSDLEELQYVELLNCGASTVDLGRWSFTKGIKFVFPAGTQLESSACLVVCRDRKAFAQQYGKEIPAVGDFSGKLSHGGETIELSNARGEVVESISYADSAPWPAGADGYSASLERLCPFASGQEPGNWAASALPKWKRPAGTPGRTNDNYATNLPPLVSNVRWTLVAPDQPTSVSAEVADADGVRAVALLWSVRRPSAGAAETEAPMERVGGDAQGGTYQAAIPGQPEGRLIRFRIRAVDASGVTRFEPAPNEPRPTYSYATVVNTNNARIAFGYAFDYDKRPARREGPWAGGQPAAEESARGKSAFIYVPPDGGEVLVFDHVEIRPRPGGFKVHFQKDRMLKDMTGINLIFENSPRRILAEPLAYEMYRQAHVPAPQAEHVRVWMDGRLLGYQLLVEQPNKSFLRRHQRDDEGHLYKLIWQGRGIVGQHEKKTHENKGHEDLVQAIEGLQQRSGDAQWEFIRQHFHVEEFINYYAVNLCIQNWDGFFNNYFTYHDTGGTGRWEIYPWDEDKTWGDYDGASRTYDWYEMPLNYGMNGARPPRWSPFSRANRQRGGFGGASWWRPPGWFSGPMLANPEFRQRFLARVEELCRTVFTEENLIPVIDALEQRLEPEIPVYARVAGDDERHALERFRSDIQSFRNQVKHRRQFLLAELTNSPAASGLWKWLLGGSVVAVGSVLMAMRRRSRIRRRRATPPPLPQAASMIAAEPSHPGLPPRIGT